MKPFGSLNIFLKQCQFSIELPFFHQTYCCLCSSCKTWNLHIYKARSGCSKSLGKNRLLVGNLIFIYFHHFCDQSLWFRPKKKKRVFKCYVKHNVLLNFQGTSKHSQTNSSKISSANHRDQGGIMSRWSQRHWELRGKYGFS